MSKDTTDDETLRQEIHNTIAQTIQIERIGRATDPKPADRIWFTTQMQDMFALSTDYLESELEKLVDRHVQAARIEELENMPLRNNDDIDWQSDRIAALQAQPLTDKDSV